ncbi:MAG: hypothetical protein ACYDHP_00305 [Ferrimicrobium sp.]
MEPWSQSMFDLFFMGAVDRLFERATARFGGPEEAVREMRAYGHTGEELVAGFVDALFVDAGIGDTAGACFVLQALERRQLTVVDFTGGVGDLLLKLAKSSFTELLVNKTIEAAELSMSYGYRGL